MKTFLEFMNEETRDQKFARIRQDAAAFGKEVDAKRAAKQTPDNIFTGSRHSDGKTVSVGNQQPVTPDKPMIGKDDAVGKLLASKGYSRSREKLNKPTERPFPDMPPQKQFGQDTKMKLLNINRKISADTAKMNEPVKKQVQPKVAARPVVSQSGYPAAKKPSLAPAESQRASSGGSYKIEPGDNPTKIAQKLGLKSVKELEARNPGILKRAKKLKIGGTINR